jgi:hypothetical protein
MEKKISVILKKTIFLLFKFLSVFYIAKHAISAIRNTGLKNTISYLRDKAMIDFSWVLPWTCYERLWLSWLEDIVERFTILIDGFFRRLRFAQLLRRLGVNYNLPYRPDFLRDKEGDIFE